MIPMNLNSQAIRVLAVNIRGVFIKLTATTLIVLSLTLGQLSLLLAQEHPAMNAPTDFAWELFIELNQEVPGTEGRVLWETWMLARDVFANPDQAPVWRETALTRRSLQEAEPLLQQVIAAQTRGKKPGPEPRPLFDPQRPAVNETRMNRSAFDFIVTNELYHVEGQEKFFTEGRNVQFPVDAKEIKARWEPISEPDRAKYHTAVVVAPDGTQTIWGLKALHITTKDVPNWFWATFEHTDNPNRESVLPSILPQKQPAKLAGTKWANYVLRGTQTDFVTATGIPTLLANSIIESGFESTSSCITCHARATIGPKISEAPNRLSVFEAALPVIRGSIGSPNPEWFTDLTTGQAKYAQLDFVWSLFRAKRKTATPPMPLGLAVPAVAPKPSAVLRTRTARPTIKAKTSPALLDVVSDSNLTISEPVLTSSDWRLAALKKAAASLNRAKSGLGVRVMTNLDEGSFRSWSQDFRAKHGESAIDRMMHIAGRSAIVTQPTPAILNDLVGDGRLLLFENPVLKAQPIEARNLDARDTHQVEEAAARHNLSGLGVVVGIWDEAGVRTTHTEFAGASPADPSRARQIDSPSGLSQHATHVSGTIGATGKVAQARGMSVGVQMHCHDWFDDTTEMVSAVGRNVACTNHSYGSIRGWNFDRDTGVWSWYGNTAVSAVEDYLFGKYTPESRTFDAVVFNNPTLNVFVAAGNDRNNSPPAGAPHLVRQGGAWVVSTATRNADGWDNGGFDTLEGHGVSKNVITIGAINDILNDPPDPADIHVTDFTNWGPTDDGRIKPDLVGNGFRLYSTSADADSGMTAYRTLSGTSMATPAATGIGALLVEAFAKQHLSRPTADLMKAVLIHTAMSPNDGPDYRIGWGSIRADLAADLIAKQSGTWLTSTITAPQYSVKGTAQSGTDIRVTLVWLDPPGNVNTGGLDDSTKTLVNDLDLEVISPSGRTHFPWSLNPQSPAAAATKTAANHRDNVERVDVTAADVTAGDWTIRVKGPAGHRFAIAVGGLVLP